MEKPNGVWRYQINYGPDGEENYANVYDASGTFVSNLKIHHAMEIVQRMNAALESQPKATPDAVECAQGIYEVLKTGKVYRLPDGEPHTGTYQEIVAEIITAHTSAAVAEAREKALYEAADYAASKQYKIPFADIVDGIRALKGK